MNVSKDEKVARLRLIRSKNVGNATYWSLISLYKSAENAIKHLSENSGKKFALCSEEAIFEEIKILKSIKARLVFFEDDLYPPELRNIDNPPPILSFIGNKDAVLNLLQNKILAVVGSRNATLNGMRFCYSICDELSKNNVTITSGLAKGIDTSAHKGSIKYGTIAILACGIDNIYPPENKTLYYKILESGGIYSESPCKTKPNASLFPRRNSIIAGISNGTLVVEAAKKSGSLITATFARNFKRQIFAVPNSPLDVRSQGGNELIKNGAHIVTCSADILKKLYEKDELLFESNEIEVKDIKCNIDVKSVQSAKRAILQLIDAYSLSIDDLIRTFNTKPEYVLMAVVELELEGKVRRTYGNSIIYSGN